MTRGDWAGGGGGSVCVGKSEVCHFAIVSNLSRHQRSSRREGKHDTQGRQQTSGSGSGWQQQGKARMQQRLRETAEAETHLYCSTINR